MISPVDKGVRIIEVALYYCGATRIQVESIDASRVLPFLFYFILLNLCASIGGESLGSFDYRRILMIRLYDKFLC